MPVRASDVLINGKRYSLAEGGDSYLIDVATPMAPKVVTGDYGYSDFTAYSVLAQSAMQGGAGQYEIGDPSFFHWSERLDTRGDRITLGVKMDTMQPTVLEQAGTLGNPHMPGNALNAVCANETYENSLEWLKLGLAFGRATARFQAQEVVSGEPAPNVPSIIGHFDANVGVSKTGVEVSNWKEQALGYKVDTFGGSVKYVADVAHGMPMIQGDGGGMSGYLPMGADSDRTIVMVCKVPIGTLGALFGFGDWELVGSKQWIIYHGTANMRLSLASAFFQGPYWTPRMDEDVVVVLSIKTTGISTDGFQRAWYDSVQQDEPTPASPEIFYDHGPALALFCGGNNEGVAELATEVMIGEMFICSQGLDMDDRWLLEDYLRSKWIDGESFGHTLAVTTTTDLERAWLYLRTHTSLDSGDVVVNLRADTGGYPGAVLATGTVDKSLISGSGSWVQVALAVTLTPGVYYHLELDCSALLRHENVEWLVGADVRGLGLGALTKTDTTGQFDVTFYDPTKFPLCLGQHPDIAPDVPVTKWVKFRGAADSFYVYGLAGLRLYRMVTERSQTPVMDTGAPKVFSAPATDMLVTSPDWVVTPDITPRLLIALGVDTDMEEWDGSLAVDTGWKTITGWTASHLMYYDNLYWRTSFDEDRGWFVQASYKYENWTESIVGGEASEWGIVGNSRFPVKALFNWKGQVYVGTTGGLFIITPEPGIPASGKLVVTKQIDLESEEHPNNFSACAVWHDDLYFSLAHGVAKLTSGNVFSSVGPERGLGDGGYTRGRFVSFHPTLTQMYATYTGNQNQWSSLMSYTGGWHIIASSGRVGDEMGAVYVDSGVYSEFPAIWLSSHSIVAHSLQPTESLKRWTYVDQVRGDNSPIRFYDRSPGYNFSDAPGILITSWMLGKMATVEKDWSVIDVDVDSVGSEQSIEVLYRLDEEQSFISIGEVTASGLTRLAFPPEAHGTKIQVQFRFFTNQTYISPVMVGYALRFAERPDLSQRAQLTLVLSDCMRHANGHKDLRSGAQMYEDLLEARRSSKPVTVELIDGRVMQMDIASMNASVARRYMHNQTRLDLATVVRLSLLESVDVPVPES